MLPQKVYEQLISQRGSHTLSLIQSQLAGPNKLPQCIQDTYSYLCQLQKIEHALENLVSFDSTGTACIDEELFPLYLERLMFQACRMHAHIQLQHAKTRTQQCVAGEQLLPWSAEAVTIRGGLS